MSECHFFDRNKKVVTIAMQMYTSSLRKKCV